MGKKKKKIGGPEGRANQGFEKGRLNATRENKEPNFGEKRAQEHTN